MGSRMQIFNFLMWLKADAYNKRYLYKVMHIRKEIYVNMKIKPVNPSLIQ
jgi:hypothetical protein